MQTIGLDGPRVKSKGALLANDTPYSLRCEDGIDYRTTDAYKIYSHAKQNWLTVYKYAYDHATDTVRNRGNIIMTFADGSQLLYAA